MNHKVTIGNLSVIKIATALMVKNVLVCTPLGDGYPYDLIADFREKLWRIQCKTGRLKNGRVVFFPKSNNGRWYKKGQKRDYASSADLIGVYCPENDRVYLLRVEDCGRSSTHILPEHDGFDRMVCVAELD